MLNSVLFTHNDLDGGGCRIIYELAHCNETKGFHYDVIICSNANVDDRVRDFLENKDLYNSDTIIYFGDIVCSREGMQALKEVFKDIRIFDHHRTNFFVQQIIPTAVIVPENALGKLESGTSLLFQHFAEIAYNDPESDWGKLLAMGDVENFLAKLVDTIRSYDTFEFKETKNVLAKKLQMFFLFIGMDQFCERYTGFVLNNLVTPDNIILADDDLNYVINEKINNEQRIIDRITPDDVLTIPIKFEGVEYKAAFGFPVYGANVSELAYQFLRKYPEYDLFIQFSLSNNMEFSYRTAREDLDCGKFAITYGGGGHPKASGSPLPENVRNAIINKLVEYLKYPHIDVAVLM